MYEAAPKRRFTLRGRAREQGTPPRGGALYFSTSWADRAEGVGDKAEQQEGREPQGGIGVVAVQSKIREGSERSARDTALSLRRVSWGGCQHRTRMRARRRPKKGKKRVRD